MKSEVLPLTEITDGVLSVWGFVLWGFVVDLYQIFVIIINKSIKGHTIRRLTTD